MSTHDVLLALSKRRLGHTLGSFRLESILGVRAITTVYAAVRADGAQGAVRVLHPELAALPEAVDLRLASARDANRVGHAAAVRVVESGDDETRPFVVMPLLEGQSIAQHAAQRGGRLHAS